MTLSPPETPKKKEFYNSQDVKMGMKFGLAFLVDKLGKE